MKVINLLPPAEQKMLQLERINGYFKRFLVLLIFSFIVMAAGFVGWRFYLNSSLNNLDSDIAKAEAIISSQDNQKIKNEVGRNNNIVMDYNNFATQNPDWAGVLTTFAGLVPREVVITNFSANSKTGKIDITGIGLTRDAVLLLRTNIEGSGKFRDINLPLENLQKPTKTPFNYTFYLAQDILFPGSNRGNPLAVPKAPAANSSTGDANGN